MDSLLDVKVREVIPTSTESNPEYPPALQNRHIFVGLAILGLAVFMLMWLSFGAEILFYAWDHPLSQFFATLREGAQTWVVSTARAIGKVGSQGITGLTVLLLIIWAIRRRFRRFWLLLVTVLGVELLWVAVVFAIGRPRPIEVRTVGNILLPSFPSGHAMLFIAFAGALLYLYYRRVKKSGQRIVLAFGVIALLLLTGFIRLFFTAHYFTDVIGGYGLGLAWTATIIPVVETVMLRRQYERQH